MNTGKEFAPAIPSKELLTCFHCGDTCKVHIIHAHEKLFCCEGCKLVFEILDEHNLCNYYNLNSAPGAKEKQDKQLGQFDFF